MFTGQTKSLDNNVSQGQNEYQVSEVQKGSALTVVITQPSVGVVVVDWSTL